MPSPFTPRSTGLLAYLVATAVLAVICLNHGPVGTLVDRIRLGPPQTGPSPAPTATAAKDGQAGPAGMAPGLLGQVGDMVKSVHGGIASGKTRAVMQWGYFDVTPFYFFSVLLACLLILIYLSHQDSGQANWPVWPLVAVVMGAIGIYVVLHVNGLLTRRRAAFGTYHLLLLAGFVMALTWQVLASGKDRLFWILWSLLSLGSLTVVLLSRTIRSTLGDYFRQPFFWSTILMMVMAVARLDLSRNIGPRLRLALVLAIWTAFMLDAWVSYIFWAGYWPYQRQQFGMIFNK